MSSAPSYRKERRGLIFVALRLLRQMEKLERKVRPVTIVKLRQHALTAQVRDILDEVGPVENGNAKTQAANVRRLKAVLRPDQSLEARLKPCIQVVISRHGGRKKLGADGQDELHRWEPLARQFKRADELRQHVREMDSASRVVLSTIHAAKGLEFQHVIVLNVIDGGLPHYKAQTDADIDQERNLFYVATTRALQQLHVFEAPCRHPRRGNTLYAERSPFLADKGTRQTFKKVDAECPSPSGSARSL